MEKTGKKGLDIDWDKLISAADNEPPVDLVVTTKAPPMSDDIQQPMDGEESNGGVSVLNNAELTQTIARMKSTMASKGARLPDRGEKLKQRIKKHEDELERRKLLHSDKETDGWASLQRHKSDSIGARNVLGQRSSLSAHPSQSAFAVCFSKKLEENTVPKIVDAFQNEIQVLNPCGHGKTLNRQLSQSRGLKRAVSSRKEHSNLRVSINEENFYAGRKSRDISTSSLHSGERSYSHFGNKWRATLSKSPRALRHVNNVAVVLLDEEEPDDIEQIQQVYEGDESLETRKIYYPSRDDPESVEICSSDMKSLDPEAYLSSPIMNFYIRYLQQTKFPADGEKCQYLCFNTYFYSKLKDAVYTRQNDKEASFVKLRRWWKGVNIFEKAYIFLPIHENLHWSLVIICIPDQQYQWGAVVLHLDSMRLHDSDHLFSTMKKFLIEEWKFLSQQGKVADLPIADKVWENFPRKIDCSIIRVPQQQNDYDCGLFVLFFMERFILEFKERIKKEDLAVFGRKWFKPEEASDMRRRILQILGEKFRNSNDK